MAQPIMFSATTTGPETEKMEPWDSWSFAGAMVEDNFVEEGGRAEETGEVEEVVKLVEEVRTGEPGSGGSSGGGDGDAGRG